MKTRNVLFVGAFANNMKDGGTGGQIYACKSLLESDISSRVNWIKIDSTAPSNINYTFLHRLFNAIKRLTIFSFFLSTKKINAVLLFTADGFSFIEKGTMALLAKMAGKKVIIAPRSGFITNDIQKPRFRKFIMLVFRKSNTVICQSERWKKLFESLETKPSESTKFMVIKNWIRISDYINVVDVNRVRNKSKNSVISLLYLAWVDKAKGIFDLIDAIHIVAKTHSNLKMVIAGDGKDFNEAKDKVRNLGLDSLFEFKGWVNHVKKMQVLSAADIFILPSYFEGLPNSLLEAMSSGVAAISTNVGSIPDIVEDGKNGLLFSPGDINKLAEHIVYLIDNQAYRDVLAEAALQTMQKDHDVNVACHKIGYLLAEN